MKHSAEMARLKHKAKQWSGTPALEEASCHKRSLIRGSKDFIYRSAPGAGLMNSFPLSNRREQGHSLGNYGVGNMDRGSAKQEKETVSREKFNEELPDSPRIISNILRRRRRSRRRRRGRRRRAGAGVFLAIAVSTHSPPLPHWKPISPPPLHLPRPSSQPSSHE